MNKYREALDYIKHDLEHNDFIRYKNGNHVDKYHREVLLKLVDKETPMKPKMVMLFGEEVPTCAREGCGVGLNPNESIWHKSSYCGNCGQKIDWSDEE